MAPRRKGKELPGQMFLNDVRWSPGARQALEGLVATLRLVPVWVEDSRIPGWELQTEDERGRYLISTKNPEQ
jgi:hypothetical protein